ncbi:hypothetical protein [Desulfovibrio gilichinskyi]|uniref:Uncharacterized protein n=1 Tax=Desulfovibrio gilichinskyi TaxID=1519643 RepID=A0A1X7CEE1_9BACT|nr:hypothetical protein [Desulfovibrio gilichinskyi]SME95192.1 hypothetical protein SAMN06295933_0770 [Desulfovibrio gilichinskyi]
MKYNRSLFACLLLAVFCFAFPHVSHAVGLEDAVERVSVCTADEKSVNRLLAAVLDSRINAKDAESILDILIDVCEQGYPPDIFLEKLDEGLGKRVRGPLILAALRRMHDNFSFILIVVSENGGVALQPIVIPGTVAANEGLSTEFIKHCIEKYGLSLGPEILGTAFSMAGELARIDFDPQLIEKIVTVGLESGSLNGSWKNISRVADVVRLKGLSDSDFYTAVIEVLKQKGSLADLMVKIGFTERNRK